MRRLAFLLGLLLVPFMWLGAEPALACSCVRSTTADFVERADAVAAARLTERDHRGQAVVYRFFGSERFKRSESISTPGFEATTSASGSSCGVPGLVVGRRYLVFMTEEGGELHINSCGGTGPLTERYVEQVEAVTGRGMAFDFPRPGPVDEDNDTASLVLRLVSGWAWWS